MWRKQAILLGEVFRFLLTHPVWDVTVNAIKADGDATNFYSHIPCGMWHQPKPPQHQQEGFLLTHPVWDVTMTFCRIVRAKSFLLTHPVWDVTVERRKKFCETRFLLTHPVWDVTSCILCCSTHIQFLLTHPVWDVTQIRYFRKCRGIQFLLTHPVWDVTFTTTGKNLLKINFYSHIPCGMWRQSVSRIRPIKGFLLTHPVWDVTKAKR